jgi:beta-lactam-binding protein with PASTA domain
MKKQGFFKEHPFWLHLIMALAASLLIVIVVFIVLRFYGRVGEEYRTPYLVGSNVDELSSSDDLELEYVIIDSLYRPGSKGGVVLRQDPDSGALIKKGRKVYLTVSSFFPDNAIVPDLRQQSVRHAISQLENVGLHGGRLYFVDDPHHVVLEQKYKGRAVAVGRRMEKGSLVDLTVGRGNGSQQTIVPYVVGMAPSKARRDILSSSLNVGAEHFDGISDMNRAIVYKQSPTYTGRKGADFGSTVELWYCDQSVVKMEELERMKRRQMEDSIRAAAIEQGGGLDEYNLTTMDEF